MVSARPNNFWFALFVAARFLTRGQNRFALLVTWLSVVGLALGVALLTLVASVMSGFDQELRHRLLQVVPHLRIVEPKAEDEFRSLLAGNKKISSIHEYFMASGALRSPAGIRPMQIYGVDADGLSKLGPVFDSLSDGAYEEFKDESDSILLGKPVAELLGLRLGDTVQVAIVVSDSVGIKPRLLSFRLIDAYEIGADPDYRLAIVNLNSRSYGAWMALGETGLEIKLYEPVEADQLGRDIKQLKPDAEIHSWSETYGQLFDAIRLEKSMMFLLLLLVVVIAAFNIVSGQMMLVSNKSIGIAVLSTMGARARLIRSIFLIQGASVGFMGVGIGMLLGVFLATNINFILDLLQQISGMHLLDGSFFVEVPTDILPQDLLVIASVSFGCCIVSSVLPAMRAARLNPKVLLH